MLINNPVFCLNFRTKAMAPHQTRSRFCISGGFGDQSLCPPGCALLPVLSHRLLPCHLHLETQRPDQSLPPDAVRLPAPHPRHDRRHVRQIYMCFSGERLHQRGEELPPHKAQPKYKHCQESSCLRERCFSCGFTALGQPGLVHGFSSDGYEIDCEQVVLNLCTCCH